jgi:tetratricopeptide (TPR) repeat protein
MPDDAKAWGTLSMAFGKLGRFSQEIASYQPAVRLKPNFAPVWYNLALAYAKSGNRPSALEAVKGLRRYDPKKADQLLTIIVKP